ncbi:MAG TPA: UDP-N-acetylmuramate dehydrogenase [Rickettsiales bacterium]|nr:UDP-N-acetylmuramate dehydrogenase [Rickettsiales bacterium]
MINIPNIKGQILTNSNLAKYSWFQVGGNADIIFKPKDIDDLKLFLSKVKMPVIVIGGGSNLLIRDKGFRGAIIILKDTFNNININNKQLEVGTGVLNSKLYQIAKENSIGGYEFLGTIPGTIGGATRGNAGCYGSEIKDLLISIEAIDFNGKLYNFTNEECRFEYRKNNLKTNLIFTKVILKNHIKKSKDEIEVTYKEMLEKRLNSQPQGVKTCGSTFKNPKEKPAWKLIQELGFQNKEINGAKMSEKHANFMINTGTATATDLENLGNLIINEAKEKQGIELEWEIKIIGEK